MENMWQKYQRQIDQIWSRDDFQNDPLICKYINRGYSFPQIEKATALFIGLNPAYSEKEEKNNCYDIKKAAEDLPKYYGRYDKLAQEINVDWTYLDLFFFKETDSMMFDQFLKYPVGLQFLVEQLKISQAIIEEISPKVIVVFNAKARKFLGLEQNRDKNEGIWMGYQAKDKLLYQQFGTHVITEVDSGIINTLKHQKQMPIPIFFDGFITYQPVAATERIAWHIMYALSMINNQNKGINKQNFHIYKTDYN